MRGFRRAVEVGADGVELDVQPSADQVAVVIHDATLDRTTDGTGSVPALPWESIAAARTGGEPVPRLEQAAAWAAESGAWLNVEVKSPGAEAAALAAIRDAGVMERTFFSSFLPEIVAEVGRLAPHATRYFLTKRWDNEVRAGVRALGVQGVCLHLPIATSEVLDELRREGLAAVVWTVDDPAEIRRLVRAGVRAVITNRPETGVAVRREESANSSRG